VQQFLNLVFSGLVTGAIYSIMASGLVLTFTTSGIFNFGHAAIAFATAYLYYQINTGLGVPIVPSLIFCAFIFAPLLGLLLDRIVLRKLASAPVYARIVGTIGLLVALPALVQWLFVTVGNDVLDLGFVGNNATTEGVPVPGIGPTPHKNYKPFGGVVLNSDQIAVFVVALIAAVGLWLVIRKTRVGLEMRAVVDRESLAGLRGVNQALTSSVAWVLTMVLAGLGGILIAPLFTLQDFVFSLVVFGCLTAVVLGGIRSIPIAFLGGLLLGVIQNLVAGYSDDILPKFLADLSGLKSAVPFFLVLILLPIFARERGRRAGSVADDTPPPDHRVGMPAWRRRLPWIVWTIVLIGFSLQWLPWAWAQADTYDQTVIAQSLAMAIIFLSFVVVTGMGGMISLAQAAFATAGGFTVGWAINHDFGVNIPLIASHGQINFLWAIALGALAAAALGALFGLYGKYLGGVALAIGTLAGAFVLYLVVWPIDDIRNGEAGWTIRQPSLSIPGLNWVNDFVVRQMSSNSSVLKLPKVDTSQLSEQILVFLAVFGLLTLVVHAFMRSPSGRATLAVRSSEVAAEASAVKVGRNKVLVFALSGAIAGIGGAMLGVFSFSFSNSTAPPTVGLAWLAIAVLAGIRRPGGALLAGLFFAGGTAVFHWIASWSFLSGGDINALITSVYFVPLLSGLGAIQVAQEPDGILAMPSLLSQIEHRNRRKELEAQRLAKIEAVAAATHGGVLPDHEQHHVAVDGVIEDEAGLAVPAPSSNGASAIPESATLIARDVIAGYGDVEVLHGVSIALEAGKVTALLGANGAGKSTLCLVAAGALAPSAGTVTLEGEDISKKAAYQRAREGILLVPEARGIFPGLTVEENLTVLLRDDDLRKKAYDRFPILHQRRKQQAGLLSGGEQQMLSLAPALADPPKVLIADEPTLGLAPLAADAVMDAIIELRDAGCAVLLVEEHAQNAMRVANTMVFMELGNVVWAGPREEASMELLTSAYLGG
jgi:ABC-type branched-subunit amino acid transport system ATPase component/branched-subunit amino acid ABC-type transport system permease component